MKPTGDVTHRPYDYIEMALVQAAMGMAFSIFNAFLLDLAGMQIDAGVVLAAALIELAAFDWFWVRGSPGIERASPVDALAFAGIVAVVTVYMILPAWPALLPPSHHYDSVHPVALANYIYQTESLPHDFTGTQPPYYPPGYPVGGAAMVALVSHWLGRVPIDTLHPLISFVLGLTAGLLYLMVRRMLRGLRFAIPLAILATLLLFTAWEYFPGSLNERYFFGQVFAQFFALVGFFHLMNYVRVPDTPTLIAILASLAAILFSHPSPLLAPTLALGLVLAERLRVNPRQAIVHGAIVAVGLGLVTWSYVLPRLAAWVGQTGYGEAVPFGVDSIGVMLPLLALVGFGLSLRARWRGRAWIGCMMLAAILAQPVALFFGQFILPSIGTYYFEKSIYLLIYPLALFAAIALAEAAEFVAAGLAGSQSVMLSTFAAFSVNSAKHLPARTPRPFAALGVILERAQSAALPAIIWGATALGALLILVLFPPRPFAPLTLSELDVARWAQHNLDTNNLGYVSPIREDAYWIQVAVFGFNPSTPSATSAYELGPMDYAEWRGNPGPPDYSIVRNTARLSIDPAVTVVYREDESAILLKPRVPPTLPPPREFTTDIHFGDMFDLVGYDLAPSSLLNAPLKATFYWRPLHWPSARVAMFVQVLDSLGQVVTRSENEMLQKRYPTQRWPIGSVVTDTWQVPLPADASAGDYTLEIAVFDQYSGRRLSVSGASHQPDEIELGPIRLSVPAPSDAELASAHPINARFANDISLLAYASATRGAGADRMLDVTLYWRSAAPVPDDYTVFVHLLDPTGRLVAQVDAPPQNGTRPTSTWQPDQVIKDPYHLKIPASLPSGAYTIEVGLYTPTDLKRLPVAGTDHVTLPQVFTLK